MMTDMAVTKGPIDYGAVWAANMALALQYPHEICIQSNGLRPGTDPTKFAALSTKTIVGQQTWGDMASMGGGPISSVTDIGVQMHCSYLEIYYKDCTPANDAAFATYMAATPNLTGPEPHRRVGPIDRRADSAHDRP